MRRELRRIMLFLGGLKRGGAERVVCDLAIGMQRRGLNVTVCSVLGGELERELASTGIDTSVLNDSGDSYHNSLFQSMLAMMKTVLLLHKKRIQVMNIHGLGPERIALAASRVAGTPLRTIVFHSNYPVLEKENGNNKVLFRIKRSLQSVQSCISVSPKIQTLVQKSNAVPAEKLSVIVNGIDLMRVQAQCSKEEMRAKLGIGLNDQVLIQVGRFHKLKNQSVSVRAMCLLIKQFPSCHLLLVGDGPEMSAIRDLLKDLPISHCVHILGLREDVRDLLAAADLFLLPSDWEGAPISLLEAFANAIPVIASDVPGITDIVALNPACAKLVKPREEKALASAIQDALQHPEWMKKAGEGASALVAKHFSSERMVDEYISFHQRKLASL